MDYKKKYEDALERAKVVNPGTTDYNIVTEIFPELKESEDERIRKHLLKHFSNKTKEEWNGMPIKNIIAWLEKQGEHANFRNKIQIGDEVTRNEDGELVNLSQFKRMVKQGEQKTDFCHHEVDFSDCSDEYRKAYYDGWNNCNQQHAQLKAEQKPAWSEEDEEAFHCLEYTVKRYYDDKDTINKYCSWLKSLKERMKGE